MDSSRDIPARLKRRAQQYIEDIYSAGEFDRVLNYVTPDFVGHDPLTGDVRGPDELVRQVRMVHSLFPDIAFRIDDQIAEGDRVLTRWTAQGTYELTGEESELPGMSLMRFSGLRVTESLRIAESWIQRDTVVLMQTVDPDSVARAMGRFYAVMARAQVQRPRRRRTA